MTSERDPEFFSPSSGRMIDIQVQLQVKLHY